MDEITKDFLIESAENLTRLDQELPRFAGDAESKELLNSIFRSVHTIKGTAGFLGFSRLQRVANAGESLLLRLQDGEIVLTPEMTSGLLAAVDAMRRMLGEIQASERDGEDDYPEVLDSLKYLAEMERGAQSGAGERPPQVSARTMGRARP